MENKSKCEIAGCDKPAQITVSTNEGTIQCCRNHTRDVLERALKNDVKYKVEPITMPET